MIPYYVDYATPSAFSSTKERDLLGLSANQRRRVRFHATVKPEYRFHFRNVLRTLGEIVWSDDTWLSAEQYAWILDPVITVHEDRVFLEAFSQDQSTYGLVICDRSIFESAGEVIHGTTNIDFTAWLWAALGEMRSSRPTLLRIDTSGFEVETKGAGGRYEGKVEIPDEWVRGFLSLMSAMAMPGTRLSVRPVDILAAIRYLAVQKAKLSPRALRYEMNPGQDAQIVLEPWEAVIPLRGAEHNYAEPRVIRTWGRRRLKLLQSLLPYAEGVDVYLKGRALPSFYVTHLPGMRLVLGLSGWTGHRWTGKGSFDLALGDKIDERLVERARATLEAESRLSEHGLAKQLGCSKEDAARALMRLCRQGRALYDVEAREVRHRELFETPIDEAKLYPPDPRTEKAQALVDAGRVHDVLAGVRETRKQRKLKTPDGPIMREITYRDWEVSGAVGDQAAVEIVVNDSGRIIFGKCDCEHFREHIFNQGPCEHMIALYAASEQQRWDLPSSTAAELPPLQPSDQEESLDEDEEE